MATRATISFLSSNGTIYNTYSHWDGYISYLGSLLLNHLSNSADATFIAEQGSISSLSLVDGYRLAIAYIDDDSCHIIKEEKELLNYYEEYK